PCSAASCSGFQTITERIDRISGLGCAAMAHIVTVQRLPASGLRHERAAVLRSRVSWRASLTIHVACVADQRLQSVCTKKSSAVSTMLTGIQGTDCANNENCRFWAGLCRGSFGGLPGEGWTRG